MARKHTRWYQSLFTLFLALLICLSLFLLLVGCNFGDGDDSADDDTGGVIDDDAAEDDVSDDDVSDDDDEVDDDVGDDDVADDDDDTVGIPDAQLMLIGMDTEGQYASWRQTDEGWLKEMLPAAPYEEYHYGLGPTFFLDGQYGFATWNEIEPGFDWSWTKSHTWLKYDVANGWQTDEARPAAGNGTNVFSISAPAADEVFAYAAREVYLVDYPTFTINHGLYHYAGDNLADTWALPLPDPEDMVWSYSLTMLTPTAGLACITAKAPESQAHLLEYNGNGWQKRALPSEYGDGCLTSLALTDTRNGLVVWTNLYENRDTELFEMLDGDYQRIMLPGNCNDIEPKTIKAQGGNALVYNGSSDYDEIVYAVRFNGQWQCQQFAKTHRFLHGIVTRKGRIFLAVQAMYGLYRYEVYEVLNSGPVEVELPADVAYIYRLHALGEGAPRFSSYDVAGI